MGAGQLAERPLSEPAGVRVPAGLHWQSRFFAATAGLWRRLGDLESRVLADDIAAVRIEKPIYVTSLARAGTTIVTELLERHPAVTSHRYSDFPNVWTPYWRNDLLQKSRRETPALEERAHRDRIRVSNDSPEAVEEILWMHFFRNLHDEYRDQVLDGAERNADFDAFYTDHVRKLLAARGASRYLAKGNYNVARLGYLHSLFPDARFVVPLRDPVQHIASLAKQHLLFLEADRMDARVGRQLSLAGHFEFGPHRTFVHFGNTAEAEAIRTCWSEGREVEGWARYWAATYRHLDAQLRAQPALRKATLLFRYEELCSHSAQVIDTLLSHCDLSRAGFEAVREEYISLLTQPDYYRPGFSDGELETIHAHCDPVFAGIGEHCLRAV